VLIGGSNLNESRVMKRPLDIVVLSDVHLGTIGCRAEELARYLNSVKPGKLILNGDFIDMWNFRKYYWPEKHMQVLKSILNMMSEGTEVFYLTGNHDEVLRKISPLVLGGLEIRDKLVLNLDGRKCWIFHGDVFDVTMKYSKWLAKLGAVGYDLLIMLNNSINMLLKLMGSGKISLSKRIKQSVKQAVKFIDDFESTAADLAIDNGYDFVICGHIHQPKIKKVHNEQGSVQYLNSGDWIEHMTALEYNEGEWNLYQYQQEALSAMEVHLPSVKTGNLLETIFAA